MNVWPVLLVLVPHAPPLAMGTSVDHLGSHNKSTCSPFPWSTSREPRGGGPHFSATQDLGKYTFVGGPRVSYAVDRLYRHVPQQKNHDSRRTWASGQAGNPKGHVIDHLQVHGGVRGLKSVTRATAVLRHGTWGDLDRPKAIQISF